MEEGFIPLGRSFFAHHLWEEERVYSRAEAWLDLIREAAWKEHKKIVSGKLIEVSRGGIVASVRFLSDRWKWSNTKVCQFLDMLREDGAIKTEKRQGVTVVLLTNYERFNAVTGISEKVEKRRGGDGETTRRRRRNDETEKGKEDEQSEEAKASSSAAEPPDPTQYEKVRDEFHRLCPALPRVRDLTEPRRKAIRARWKHANGQALARFEELFTAAQASDFLTGRAETSWMASFDWLLKPTNAQKVLEGNYANDKQKGKTNANTHPRRTESTDPLVPGGW